MLNILTTARKERNKTWCPILDSRSLYSSRDEERRLTLLEIGAPALAVTTELFLLAREMLAKVKTQETMQALKGVHLRGHDLRTVDFIADDPELVVFVEIGQEPWIFAEAVL